MQTNIFCTLFNTAYLLKGFALYYSMVKHIKDFHLYILCMDDETYKILKKLSLSNVTLISLSEFENEELKKVKTERTTGEYCWTCTPALIKYVLETYNPPIITYLDADIFFFSDVQPIFEEFGNNSILMTEHNYTLRYDQTDISGKYNVQFVTIRNDEDGKKCVSWWKDKCVEWCYARVEKNKFGDQRYLDEWHNMFKGVHVLKYKGAGVAPWNVNNYEVSIDKEKVLIEGIPLIFYHFHNLFIYKKKFNLIKGYFLKDEVKKYLYFPYIKAIREVEYLLPEILDGFYFKESFVKKISEQYFLLKKYVLKYVLRRDIFCADNEKGVFVKA